MYSYTLPVKNVDTPYEWNVFSFIQMTDDIAVSHGWHENYVWTHMELGRKQQKCKKPQVKMYN